MDPPETPYIHDFFLLEGISVMNMAQAEALHRHLPFLHVIDVPKFSVDIQASQPPENIQVVATTMVLVAKRQLHPALVYLLMSIVDEVHEAPTLLQKENEFPADKDVDLPLSPQSEQFYKDGKPFLQRYLPFGLASLVERLIKVLIPLVAIIVPLTNYVPKVIQWRSRRKATRCYQRLMQLEAKLNAGAGADLHPEFERLVELVDRYLHSNSVPANEIYILKEHIELVRRKLEARVQTS